MQPKTITKIGLIKPTSFEFATQYVNHQTSVDKSYGYYFREDVALFEFFEGNEMRVSSLTEDFNEDFLRALLNYPMACLLYQKGYFLLHASAVAFENKVYLFPGPSMSGKSTLVSYLVKKGGQLITEDTAAISIHDDAAYISPAYPLIKISPEANTYIGLSKSSGINFPRDINTRRGHLLGKASFATSTQKIDFCIFPEWADSGSFFEKISFFTAMGKLLSSSPSLLSLSRSKEKDLLTANANFLKNVSTYIYKREQAFSSLDSLIESLSGLQRQRL